MTILRLLGGVSLHDAAGARLDGSIHRRRLALLVMLATAARRAAGREKLMATLWPDSDTTHARNLLNQAVHGLRRVLGKDAILAEGDELCLDVQRVQCDVAVFEKKFNAQQWADAVDVYGGPFLDGAHLCPTSEFEQWVDGERTRLAGQYEQALTQLAQTAEAAGDGDTAVRAWTLLAAHDPVSTPIVLRLMHALEATGNRAAAIRCADAHAERLRRDLGMDPDPELRAQVERLRRAGESHLAVRDGDERGAKPASAPTANALPSQAHRPGMRPRLVMSGVAVVIVMAAIAFTTAQRTTSTSLADPAVVFVAPFRVSGAASDLAFLREGMVDLLATSLNGEGGPRAVDPRAALSAWNRETRGRDAEWTRKQSLALAHALGAGLLLEGEVVGTTHRMVLSARVVRTGDGTPIAASITAGPSDSLPALVDRLTAALLSLSVGEDRERLPALTTTSLPALRAYLQGQSSYRHGQFRTAVKYYDDALRQDSSFVLAALGIATAGAWYDDRDRARGLALATRGRDRLSTRDRALLDAQGSVGADVRSADELLAAAERAVQLAPDNPEAWHRWGELMLRVAARAGRPEDRGVGYLERAVELDPTFVPSLIRLIELAVWAREGERAAAYGRLYEATATSDGHGPYVRWLLAVGGAHPAKLRAVRAAMDTMPIEALEAIAASANRGAIGLEDAARANAIRRARAISHRDREYALAHSAALALNRGRPREASSYYDAMIRDPFLIHYQLRGRVLDALYWDAEVEPAEIAARQLDSLVALPATSDRARRDQRGSACVLEQKRLWQGDAAWTDATLRLLDASGATSQICVPLLRAMRAVISNSAQAAREVARLEEVLASSGLETPNYLPLVVSRLYRRVGDNESALRALQRRRRLFPDIGFRSTSLREEAELLTLLGDTSGAAAARRQYGLLRGASQQ